VRVRNTFLEFPARLLLEEEHSWSHVPEPRARSAPASRTPVAGRVPVEPQLMASESPQRLLPSVLTEQHAPLVLELSTLTATPPTRAISNPWVSESSPWTGLLSGASSSHSTQAWSAGHFFIEADASAVHLSQAQSASPDAVAAVAAVEDLQLGSLELPTVGSKDHYFQKCKPCAFVHKKGCNSGVNCQFCHICGPEIKRRRQLERLDAKRRIWRQKAKEAAREAKKLAEMQAAGVAGASTTEAES